MMRFLQYFYLFLIVLFVAGGFGPSLYGAEITVPRLEMASRGAFDGDEFVFSSSAMVDIAIKGGYKYGAAIGLSLVSGSLEDVFGSGNFQLDFIYQDPTMGDYNNLVDRFNRKTALSLSHLEANANQLFSLPMDFSYFLGKGDIFASGDDFPAYFGTAPLGSGFRGFLYFSEGIGGDISRQYNGIYQVNGSGVSLTLTPWEWIRPMLYVYQDLSATDGLSGLFKRGRFSADLRALISRGIVNIDVFAGITVGKDENPAIRSGFLVNLKAGGNSEIVLQAGIPGWRFGDDFGVDNLYFLLEPRMRWDLYAVHLTFFYHPVFYNQVKTPDEQGKADINIKFLYGNVASTMVEGGLELSGGMQHITRLDKDEVYFYISPFLSLVSGGLRWDFKVRTKLLNYDKPKEIFDTFISVRTAF